jgi:hypothetical protein
VPHTGLELSVDRRRVASSTREERTGPYTLMLATAIPELGLRLYSTYVCSQHTDSVAVHLELGTDPKRPLAVRRYPHGELPVVQARQRCGSSTPPTCSNSSATSRAAAARSTSLRAPAARRRIPTGRCKRI